MARSENPGRDCHRAGVGMPNHATAEGIRTIARKRRLKEAGTPYRITPNSAEPLRIVVAGRVRWALDRLCLAGAEGCTPITEPAPRWAAYVHSLREMGVEIETLTEPHGGAFSGHHARYVLRCGAVLDWNGGAE